MFCKNLIMFYSFIDSLLVVLQLELFCRLTYLLGYNLEEVVGKTLYNFVHPNDVFLLRKCHSESE